MVVMKVVTRISEDVVEVSTSTSSVDEDLDFVSGRGPQGRIINPKSKIFTCLMPLQLTSVVFPRILWNSDF